MAVTPTAAGGVVVREVRGGYLLANDRLEVTVAKEQGILRSVRLDGVDLLGGGTGYWSMSASSGASRVSGFGVARGSRVSIDPALNGGERGEVACGFHGKGVDGAFPGQVEVRYALAAGATTLHAMAVLRHGAGDADFRMGEGRFVIKVSPRHFDYLAVDRDRHGVMPSPADWLAGEPMNLKEVRRIVSGPLQGRIEHKYAYSAILWDVPAYGWAGTRSGYGVWMINPAVEYLAGGPAKMELTGHLDVGGAAMPTLLNMWHGSHYGGTALGLARDEEWSRVIGPFAVHFNRGASPAEAWKEAVAVAHRERAAWPYAWVREDLYPLESGRGVVSGKVEVKDPHQPALRMGRMQVGLTAGDGTLGERGGRGPEGWQRDGKHYQYWAEAAADGSFRVGGVRPGTYVLRAIASGVAGEMVRGQVEVTAGHEVRLGAFQWVPERAGPTLWQIGVPDRGAAEFRNGDRYWQWGNHLKYKQDFPQGVDYRVGVSRWERDWHLCQPLDLDPTGRVLGPSMWTVRFDLDRVPDRGALLRIGFCGSRAGARLDFILNGQPLGDTGPLPENGVMHRDSHRGHAFQRTFEVPAEGLVKGANILQLRLSGNAWYQGVLYDFLRLEERTP